jgi:hypothetical protein
LKTIHGTISITFVLQFILNKLKTKQMKTTINEFLERESKKERKKKIVLLIAVAIIAIANVIAQTSNNSIVVFTEGGEKFTLILNGLRQNTNPETNVKAQGLNQANYKARIIFDQKGLPDCDKSIPMMWGAEPVSNTEFVFSVSKDKRGNYKWKFVSQGPVSQSTYAATASLSGSSGTAGSNTVTPANPPGDVNLNSNTVIHDNSEQVSTTTTTTSTGTTNGTNNANINVGVNGMGVNLSFNVNDGMNGANSGTTTTTTTTYSTTTTNGVTGNSSGSNTQVTTGVNGNVGMNIQVNGTGTAGNSSTYTSTSSSTAANTEVVQSSGNCGSPMGAIDFADAKKSIADKSFEETKLTLARQVAGSNCLSAEQIRTIMALFSFEESRLEFAKYCYSNCYDKKNYYKINDAFSFEASTEELNEYVMKRQ